MSNEAEILNNPTTTPAAVSTGYQRQNINAVASRVGMDKTVVSGGTGKCTLEISGPVDVNGILYSIGQAKDFTLSSADRYYIYLSGSGDYLTPTIDTDPGTFDADKNARYTAGGYRVLNWVIDYDGTTAVAYQWLNPSEDGNCFIENYIEGTINKFKDVVELTGTTDSDSSTNIAYPDGYTKTNTYLLSGKVYTATGSWFFIAGGSALDTTLYLELQSSTMILVHSSAIYQGQSYKLLLTKI